MFLEPLLWDGGSAELQAAFLFWSTSLSGGMTFVKESLRFLKYSLWRVKIVLICALVFEEGNSFYSDISVFFSRSCLDGWVCVCYWIVF